MMRAKLETRKAFIQRDETLMLDDDDDDESCQTSRPVPNASVFVHRKNAYCTGVEASLGARKERAAVSWRASSSPASCRACAG